MAIFVALSALSVVGVYIVTEVGDSSGRGGGENDILNLRGRLFGYGGGGGGVGAAGGEEGREQDYDDEEERLLMRQQGRPPSNDDPPHDARREPPAAPREPAVIAASSTARGVGSNNWNIREQEIRDDAMRTLKREHWRERRKQERIMERRLSRRRASIATMAWGWEEVYDDDDIEEGYYYGLLAYYVRILLNYLFHQDQPQYYFPEEGEWGWMSDQQQYHQDVQQPQHYFHEEGWGHMSDYHYPQQYQDGGQQQLPYVEDGQR